MRHASTGELRRLIDDPWAVPEAARSHLRTCGYCGRRQHRIHEDAELAAARLPDLPAANVGGEELALTRLKRRAEAGDTSTARPQARRFRLRRKTAVLGACAVVLVAGTSAAAGELASVVTPTKVAPVQLGSADLSALLRALPSATLTQSDAGAAYAVANLASAEHRTGLRISLPTTLPAGVSASPKLLIQPRVSATITFRRPTAGEALGHQAPPAWLAGTTLRVQAGPAVVAVYPSKSGPRGLPGLVVGVLPSPVLSATGATPEQIEQYVLSRPGVSPALAAEIRALGAPGAVIPIPVPTGAAVHQVPVDGAPAVVLSDPDGFVSAVMWEQAGLVRVVGGLISSNEALQVADELG